MIIALGVANKKIFSSPPSGIKLHEDVGRCVEWRVSRVSEVTGKVQLKVARAILFTRNVGNRDLRCFLSVTFRRLRGGGGSIVCLLYSLYKGQGPPSLSELLPATVQARTEIVLRSSHSFRFPFASSSRHLSSFLCFSIRLWNTLPASAISQSSSVSSFRSFLHSFYKADKFSLGL